MQTRVRIIVQHLAAFSVVLISVTAGGIWPAFEQYHQKSELATRGHIAQAAVTATECSNHGNVAYTFEVAGQKISKTSNACGPTCSPALVSSTVQIRYLDEQPSINECGKVEKKAEDALIIVYGLIALCLLAGVLLLIRCGRALKRNFIASPE